MLYPLSYGGAPTVATRVHTPDSVETVIYLRPACGLAWPGLAWCVLHTLADVAATGPRVARSPKAEALGPAHPPCCRGRLACARRLPRRALAFPASFHPYPRHARADGDRSTLCCGCRHMPSQTCALTCCFVRPTCMWQSGSSSSTRVPATVCPGCLERCIAEGETRTPTLLTRTRPST